MMRPSIRSARAVLRPVTRGVSLGFAVMLATALAVAVAFVIAVPSEVGAFLLVGVAMVLGQSP
jgi:hypothetical protein